MNKEDLMRLPNLVPAAAMLIALSACSGEAAKLSADQASVRLNANGTGPAAGYLTIHGGAQPVKLVAVTSDGAARVEMHENSMSGGMMMMKPLDSLDVPARSNVAFAPGGKHLMIYGIAPATVEAGKMTLTLSFSDGKQLAVVAPIEKAGANGAVMGDNASGMSMEHGAHGTAMASNDSGAAN